MRQKYVGGITLSLCALFSLTSALPQLDAFESYEGHQIISVHSSDRVKREALGEVLKEKCDPLKWPTDSERAIDVLCPPEHLDHVKDHLDRSGAEFSVKVENVADHISLHDDTHARRKRAATKQMGWDDFQRYETIKSWMENLASEYPDFTQLINMGKSVEGRVLYALKIGKSPQGDKTPAVWIDGGIHAREWLSPAVASYLLNQLTKSFSQQTESGKVTSIDWYVAPLINPDGYEYSHTNKRYWRKNRSQAPSGTNCRGVDLNRNWNVVGFGAGATSSSPCSDVYKGPKKGSEPETQAVAETVLKYKENIKVYLTLHSYGSYWLTTWGYTAEPPVDHDKQIALAKRGANAIKSVNSNRGYTVGSAGAIFYIAGGASDDWAKATAEIPYSFTIELPGNDFVISKSEIIKVGEEMWAATKEMAKEVSSYAPPPSTTSPPPSTTSPTTSTTASTSTTAPIEIPGWLRELFDLFKNWRQGSNREIISQP